MGELTFRVPFGAAESEFTEKRSRFIGYLQPVETEAQAQEFVRRIKAKHYDARHNCWCYRIGQTLSRYSDDGEPQGTAGQPMLKVYERENVTNFVCVVTRYFGGILLGAGGLTRAYSKGAKDVLVAAGAATMGRWVSCAVPCSYALLERVRQEVESLDGIVDTIDYAAEVVLHVSVPAAQTARLQARLTELSAGGLSVQIQSEEYRPGRKEEVK